MPQNLHVIKCYKCNTFQVDIVKKAKKWVCKMCGEKQSLTKVYGTGSGKDCRTLVQHLNIQAQEYQYDNEGMIRDKPAECDNGENEEENILHPKKKQKLESEERDCHKIVEKRSSKWSEFLIESNSNEDHFDDEKLMGIQKDGFSGNPIQFDSNKSASNSKLLSCIKKNFAESNETEKKNELQNELVNIFENSEDDIDTILEF